MNNTDLEESIDEHLAQSRTPSTDPDYVAYKKNKIEKGLAESQDRTKLIPAEKVWEDLGLER